MVWPDGAVIATDVVLVVVDASTETSVPVNVVVAVVVNTAIVTDDGVVTVADVVLASKVTSKVDAFVLLLVFFLLADTVVLEMLEAIAKELVGDPVQVTGLVVDVLSAVGMATTKLAKMAHTARARA